MRLKKSGDWSNTKVTDLLKIQYPIFQGPFGRGGSTPLLTATVSNAGGLGGFGANELSSEQLTKVVAEIRALTDKPFNINLWISTFDDGGEKLDLSVRQKLLQSLAPFYKELGLELPSYENAKQNSARSFADQVEALLEVKPAVFSFLFGIPDDDILQRCRKDGIKTAGIASTPDEANALEEAGVDIIVASGFEAGGHHSAFLKSAEDSQIGTFALIPQIADVVKIPVVAAGGIADGRGVAAALMLGADAVQIGTAFLACDESGASDAHRQLLFSKSSNGTTLSRAFTGRLARGVQNQFAEKMECHEEDFAPYPAHSWILAPLREAALSQGRLDLLGLWSGQAASLIRYHNADELFVSLVRDTSSIFENKR